MRILRTGSALLLMVAVAACDGGMETDEADLDETTQPAVEETQPAPQQAAMDTAALRNDIDRLRERWVQAANDGDVTAIAAMYAEDAVMVGAGGEEWQGAGAIREGLSAAFQNLTSFEATAMDTEVGGGLVSEMGSFNQTLRMEQGELTQAGYYVVLARPQADGELRIVQHLGLPSRQPEAAQPGM